MVADGNDGEASSYVTFTIENKGSADLIITGINISGTDPNSFDLVDSIITPVTPGTNTTFTIRFDPLTIGSKSATVTINNNDGDENVYTFNIIGKALVKLTANDGASNDYFGYSVSISGNYAIIGAYKDEGGASGSAYIFYWNGSSWVEQTKLRASDSLGADEFGTSVCISGEHAIVGAPGRNVCRGKAYIYYWNGSNWVEQEMLTASDGAFNDYFGHSVSISGNYAIVGAYKDDDMGTDSGSAYIFYWNGSSWVEQTKLTASNGEEKAFFGYSVSISGNYAVVGAMWGDTYKGSAYIYYWNGLNWIEQTKLTGSDTKAVDEFGTSVYISGNYAIIGSVRAEDNETSTGAAYIFYWNGSNWVEQIKLTASDGLTGERFGLSVSISGNYAIVGTGTGGDSIGSAYIFYWNGSTWVEKTKLCVDEGDDDSKFGCSVGLSGNYAIVGDYEGDGNESGSGCAYLFYNQ